MRFENILHILVFDLCLWLENIKQQADDYLIF